MRIMEDHLSQSDERTLHQTENIYYKQLEICCPWHFEMDAVHLVVLFDDGKHAHSPL